MAGQGLRGEDIRAGILQADDTMHDVKGDIHTMAGQMAWKGIDGKDREEFLKGLTKDEYNTLYAIAQSQGPKGMSKLEQILQEAIAFGESKGSE